MGRFFDRFLGAFLTFGAVLFAQIFALAAAEGFAHLHIAPFGSRNALLVAMLTVSAAAAMLRWRKPAKQPAPSQRASTTTGSVHAGAGAPSSASRSSAFGAANLPAAPQPPPLSPRGAEILQAASRQAIVFRQHFPPRFDPDHRSFFGGAPVAPRAFLWPRGGGPAAQGRPLAFLMQVDCAAIPAAARLGAFPDRGALYFFLDLSQETLDGRVLYADSSQRDWQPVAVPDDLGPAFGKHAAHNCGWAQSAGQCPSLLPRWTFDPVVIELPEPVRNADEDDDENAPALWPGDSVGDKLLEAAGIATRYDYLTVRDVVDGKSVRRPFATFPHDWRALAIASAGLVERVERERRYPKPSTLADTDKDTADSILVELSAEAQSWFDRASAMPPFDEVPTADRDEFWQLVARHPSISRSMLVEALTESMEASLAHSERAASRVPAELAARIRGRHALAVMTESGLHANIPDRMLAPPVDVQGNQWERAQTHLLLLELSSNDGLGHHFGEGVYQFWIRPEDLMAGRFDKVELTADAY